MNINKDENEYWNKFKDNLLISQVECIPRKYIINGQPFFVFFLSTTKPASWFCHDIKILNKDKLYKKWKNLPSETNLIASVNIKKEIDKTS